MKIFTNTFIADSLANIKNMKKSAYCKLNKYWLLLLISFFASFWFVSDARAAADATLSLAITPQTVNINDTVDLVVTENPGTNANIRAVDMFIQFDPAVLRLDSIENNVAGSATFGTARIGGVALVGSNDVAILHFTALAVGIESAVTFEAGTAIWDSGVNVTNVAGLTGAVVNVSDPADVTGPTIAEVTPVSTPGSDTTPNYTFSSTEIGTIVYGGDCSSSTTLATSGNNTIIFDALAGGAHSNCTVTLTDASSNASNLLAVTAFTIDTTAPVVTQVTPVTTPTIDTTPSYTFNTDEAGTVAYGGDAARQLEER